MDIQFIGTGGAFDWRYGNSAAIAGLNSDTPLLIDCGHSIMPRLLELELLPRIKGVFITHLHDDHAGSLSSLLYALHFINNTPTPVYAGHAAFRDELIAYLKFPMGDPSRFADFRLIEELPGFSAIDTTGRHFPGMSTHALLHEGASPEDTWLFSGDIADPNFLFETLTQRGLRGITVFHDITFQVAAKPHAYYEAVQRHLDAFPIFGYHHDASQKPADCRIPLVAETPTLLLPNG